MALETTALKNIVGVLAGHIQTLISIARKGSTDPADQAAVDAIEKALTDLDTAVAQADSDLGPTGSTGTTGPTGGTGISGTTGPDGSTGA